MRSRHRATLAVAVALLAAAALLPAFSGARPAGEIPVHHAPDEADSLSSPTGAEWDRAPAATVALTSAPSSVPGADETSVERMRVEAATADDRLYLRLSWSDATADRSDADPRTFADAVAVQMPVNTSARPAIAMGSTRNLVNVWYWRGSTGREELLAGGAGSTTSFGNGTLAANATRTDGRWAVVLSRPRSASGDNRTAITDDRDLDVAFAVWNGSNAERSGRKSVSEWHYLALGPGPSGPPYEAVLWGIAGLAILGVVLLTVDAVRRAE